MNLEAGSSLTLTCNYNLSLDKSIEEEVNWKVNGTAVSNRISTAGSTLSFSSLATSDTGQYICELTLTIDQRITYVTVQESPVMSSGVNITVQSKYNILQYSSRV